MHAPECSLVGVGWIFCDQIRTRAIDGLAVLRHGVRKIPHHGTRLGVTERMTTVILHTHANDATGEIGLPVLALCGLLFGFGQFGPPAQFLHENVVKFGIAGGDIGTF